MRKPISTDIVLSCSGLVKAFDGVRAVDGLDLEIQSGQIFGLLGPNGSGKTTTIRTALGIYVPDGGSLSILGQEDPLTVRERLGYLPEERGLYQRMRIGEQLAFLASLRGLPRREAGKRSTAWLERLGLADREQSEAIELSKGMQQKVQFAAAVIHDPDLVVLDEPFSGLDPVNTRLLKELILEQREKGTSVVLSTHRMDQVEQMCESICLIHRGKAVLSGRLGDVKASYGKSTIKLTYEGESAALREIAGVREVRDSGRSASLLLEPDADSQGVLRQLLARVVVLGFTLEEPSVEDIFLDKVGYDPRAAQDSAELAEAPPELTA